MTEFIKNILVPSNLVIIFFVVGLILLITRKRKRPAMIMFALSAVVYIIFGTGVIALWLLGSLEHRYKPLVSIEGVRAFKTIVILAGHAEKQPGLPLSSEVNFASAYRLIEGLRIIHLLPDTKILISGRGEVPGIMKDLLASMGLPGQRIIIDNQSSNTHESAVNVRRILDQDDFVLVTSAGHMPRAIETFRKAGMNPVPAPTNYMSVKERRFIHYLPSPHHLVYADLAVHEYLGMAWYRIADRM
jgi:uncharacterized SAM-binding protein YcdF (DUF218 family)